jgi:hypothetical protein
MPFKSDNQRKAFFAKQGNVRSNVNSIIVKDKPPIFELTYSDGKKFLSTTSRKVGKAEGEAGEMGLRVIKVRKIINPTFLQKVRAF